MLEKALAESHKQNESTKRDHVAMRDSIESLQQEIEALNEMLSEANMETDSWKTRFGDLQTEHELAQANWTEREEELMALQAEAQVSGVQKNEDGEKGAWEQKHKDLEAQIKELTDAHKELEEVLARTQEQHASILEDWKAKHLALHNEYDKYIDDMTHEHGTLSDEIAKLKYESSELRAQVQEKDDDIERLTAVIEEKEINRSVVDANRSVLGGESNELRAALEEATAECERLTALLHEQTERLSAMEKAHSDLSPQLLALEAEKAKLKCEVAEYTQECERLSNLVAEKDKECERLSQLAANAQVLQREHSQSLLCSVELRV